MPDDQSRPAPETRVARRGSIGDLCNRVGCDVRDLILEGYTWDEIYEVAWGRLTLEELQRRGPAARRR